jgi:hypothetical protein
MMTKAQAYEMLEYFVRRTGQRQVVARPLVENIPAPREGWQRTPCPKCGRDCWKTEFEPDELPEHVSAACTSCALRAGIPATETTP